jgi:hypothetical protein
MSYMPYRNHTISSLMKVRDISPYTYLIEIYISDKTFINYQLTESVTVYSFTDIIKFLVRYNILTYHSVPNIFNQINTRMKAILYAKTNTFNPVRIIINKIAEESSNEASKCELTTEMINELVVD